MLPPGAFAIILLVGGVQIHLPVPAFVAEGRVWVPARSVLERVGYRAEWVANSGQLAVSVGQRKFQFPVSDDPVPPALSRDEPFISWRRGLHLYLPLTTLQSMGLNVGYDPSVRMAWIENPETKVATPSLAAILADPLSWNGLRVRLNGEYLGWSPHSDCYATKFIHQPGAFILHNDAGAIYCQPPTNSTIPRASLSPLTISERIFTPFQAIGRRLEVSGLVKIATAGYPWLQCDTITTPSGLAGLTCILRLDRKVYLPSQLIYATLMLHNPTTEPILFTPAEKMYLSVADPTGEISIFQPKMASSLWLDKDIIMQPGEHLNIMMSWQHSATVYPGHYRVSLQAGELHTYAAGYQILANKHQQVAD